MSNIDSGPFEEGQIAASEGEALGANPYEKGTDEYDLWRDGFKSGEDLGDGDDDLTDDN